MSSNPGSARGYRVYGVELLNEERRSESRHESPRGDPPHREEASPPLDDRRSYEEVQFYGYDGEKDGFYQYDGEDHGPPQDMAKPPHGGRRSGRKSHHRQYSGDEERFHRSDDEEEDFQLPLHRSDSYYYRGSLAGPLIAQQRIAAPSPTSARSSHWTPMQVESRSGGMPATAPPPKKIHGVRSPEQQRNRELVHAVGRCLSCKAWRTKCDPETPCGSCLKYNKECIRPGQGQ